ncbi:unnamed protein product [Amoebophrya sp. A120]|nr:unnamed protein product [Amoebophrya sp. A120]|eukprot:GSA120T00004875001.1
MPCAGLIAGKILCMHGGISPRLTNLREINQIQRPCGVPDNGLLCDLLWSDPANEWQAVNPGKAVSASRPPNPAMKTLEPVDEHWGFNARGVSWIFDEVAVQECCDRFGLDLIVRAHQKVEDGYEFYAKKRMLTVFSAPNYCGTFDNNAGVLNVSRQLRCKLTVLEPEHHIGKGKFHTWPGKERKAMELDELTLFPDTEDILERLKEVEDEDAPPAELARQASAPTASPNKAMPDNDPTVPDPRKIQVNAHEGWPPNDPKHHPDKKFYVTTDQIREEIARLEQAKRDFRPSPLVREYTESWRFRPLWDRQMLTGLFANPEFTLPQKWRELGPKKMEGRIMNLWKQEKARDPKWKQVAVLTHLKALQLYFPPKGGAAGPAGPVGKPPGPTAIDRLLQQHGNGKAQGQGAPPKQDIVGQAQHQQVAPRSEVPASASKLDALKAVHPQLLSEADRLWAKSDRLRFALQQAKQDTTETLETSLKRTLELEQKQADRDRAEFSDSKQCPGWKIFENGAQMIALDGSLGHRSNAVYVEVATNVGAVILKRDGMGRLQIDSNCKDKLKIYGVPVAGKKYLRVRSSPAITVEETIRGGHRYYMVHVGAATGSGEKKRFAQIKIVQDQYSEDRGAQQRDRLLKASLKLQARKKARRQLFLKQLLWLRAVAKTPLPREPRTRMLMLEPDYLWLRYHLEGKEAASLHRSCSALQSLMRQFHIEHVMNRHEYSDKSLLPRLDEYITSRYRMTNRPHKLLEKCTTKLGALYQNEDVSQPVGPPRVSEGAGIATTNETLKLDEMQLQELKMRATSIQKFEAVQYVSGKRTDEAKLRALLQAVDQQLQDHATVAQIPNAPSGNDSNTGLGISKGKKNKKYSSRLCNTMLLCHFTAEMSRTQRAGQRYQDAVFYEFRAQRNKHKFEYLPPLSESSMLFGGEVASNRVLEDKSSEFSVEPTVVPPGQKMTEALMQVSRRVEHEKNEDKAESARKAATEVYLLFLEMATQFIRQQFGTLAGGPRRWEPNPEMELRRQLSMLTSAQQMALLSRRRKEIPFRTYLAALRKNLQENIEDRQSKHEKRLGKSLRAITAFSVAQDSAGSASSELFSFKPPDNDGGAVDDGPLTLSLVPRGQEQSGGVSFAAALRHVRRAGKKLLAAARDKGAVVRYRRHAGRPMSIKVRSGGRVERRHVLHFLKQMKRPERTARHLLDAVLKSAGVPTKSRKAAAAEEKKEQKFVAKTMSSLKRSRHDVVGTAGALGKDGLPPDAGAQAELNGQNNYENHSGVGALDLDDPKALTRNLVTRSPKYLRFRRLLRLYMHGKKASSGLFRSSKKAVKTVPSTTAHHANQLEAVKQIFLRRMTMARTAADASSFLTENFGILKSSRQLTRLVCFNENLTSQQFRRNSAEKTKVDRQVGAMKELARKLISESVHCPSDAGKRKLLEGRAQDLLDKAEELLCRYMENLRNDKQLCLSKDQRRKYRQSLAVMRVKRASTNAQNRSVDDKKPSGEVKKSGSVPQKPKTGVRKGNAKPPRGDARRRQRKLKLAAANRRFNVSNPKSVYAQKLLKMIRVRKAAAAAVSANNSVPEKNEGSTSSALALISSEAKNLLDALYPKKNDKKGSLSQAAKVMIRNGLKAEIIQRTITELNARGDKAAGSAEAEKMEMRNAVASVLNRYVLEEINVKKHRPILQALREVVIKLAQEQLADNVTSVTRGGAADDEAKNENRARGRSPSVDESRQRQQKRARQRSENRAKFFAPRAVSFREAFNTTLHPTAYEEDLSVQTFVAGEKATDIVDKLNSEHAHAEEAMKKAKSMNFLGSLSPGALQNDPFSPTILEESSQPSVVIPAAATAHPAPDSLALVKTISDSSEKARDQISNGRVVDEKELQLVSPNSSDENMMKNVSLPIPETTKAVLSEVNAPSSSSSTLSTLHPLDNYSTVSSGNVPSERPLHPSTSNGEALLQEELSAILPKGDTKNTARRSEQAAEHAAREPREDVVLDRPGEERDGASSRGLASGEVAVGDAVAKSDENKEDERKSNQTPLSRINRDSVMRIVHDALQLDDDSVSDQQGQQDLRKSTTPARAQEGEHADAAAQHVCVSRRTGAENSGAQEQISSAAVAAPDDVVKKLSNGVPPATTSTVEQHGDSSSVLGLERKASGDLADQPCGDDQTAALAEAAASPEVEEQHSMIAATPKNSSVVERPALAPGDLVVENAGATASSSSSAPALAAGTTADPDRFPARSSKESQDRPDAPLRASESTGNKRGPEAVESGGRSRSSANTAGREKRDNNSSAEGNRNPGSTASGRRQGRDSSVGVNPREYNQRKGRKRDCAQSK